MPRLIRWSFLLALLAPAGTTPAADHPIVPGYERFFASGKTDLARAGRLLLSELSCLRCHAPADRAATGRGGPVLDDVARRARPGWLRRYLADPHAVKPGTTMPDLLAGDPDRTGKVEALVHFLSSTGALRHERPLPKAISSGRTLYDRAGCVACHGTRKASGEADRLLSTSVPLGDLKAKYTVPGLAAFLQDPLHARPAGRMPRLLEAKEAKDVASYLLQGLQVELAGGKGTSRYAYYEGSWDRLPDFGKLRPAATGIAQGFDLTVSRRDNDFAIVFEALLPIDREDTYRFGLTSDDGSKLLIDGKVVVDNDGVHAPQTKRGRTRLAKGMHKVAVAFFQVGGGVELDVQISAPGFGQHSLANLVAASEAELKKPAPKKDDPDAIEINPDLARKGSALFASLGCASCHAMKSEGKTIASTLPAPALAKLDAGNGCLSASPGKKVPRYGLSKQQTRAIQAALKGKPAATTPAARIADTMLTFNCYACHVRDKVGGPQEELNKSFQTTQPEMGDEGRLPPPLDGVGAKLQKTYFQRILDQGAHDRPYMHTRMPGFGADNVGHLVEAFAAVDRLPTLPAITFKEPLAKVKAQARLLVGAQALGCIKCHTFAGRKAEGVQGIDLLKMPQRLRREWFHAYVADPQRIRPGTRMPASYVNGKGVLPEVLDGTAATQIEAMWVYLQDGTRARVPVGIGRAFMPLVPTTSAIVYRNFIQGAGSRAIAVGYPEKVHLAFDANELRLALLWQGDFLDAARHWTDRGVGFEAPLGDNVLHRASGPDFAILAKADTPWPTGAARANGQRFRGYRLTKDDRPTFLYQLGDVRVEDFPAPVVTAKTQGLRRTLTLSWGQTSRSAQGGGQTGRSAPTKDLYFRAAVAGKIERQADGSYKVDGYRLKLSASGARPIVRKAGARSELIVPVTFKDGKALLVQEYTW